jgi:hypothetical protein
LNLRACINVHARNIMHARIIHACMISVALLPAARADKPDNPEPPKVKASAFALAHPDVAAPAMVEVMRAVENGLRQNPRLEMKDLDTRLADFAQEAPQEQIDAARAAQKEGEQALLELRIADAVAKLEDAVAGLSQVLPYIKKQELADAMASLAVAQFEGGDRKAGRAEFIELLTWRPDFTYDPQKLPPRYEAAFEEAQREVEHARRGSLRIATVPDGAQAYVDGKYVGVSPCVADALAVGKHFITLKKEGYRKAVAAAQVSPRRESLVELGLERSRKYLLVEQALAKVEQTIGDEAIAPDADNLKQVLFVEHAVFVRAQPKDGGVSVEAWLYDLRTRRRLAHVHQAVAAGGEAKLDGLAASLYAGVNYEGVLQAPVDLPPPRAVVRPFYKTWWFWTAAGAVVLGAVGTGVAVAETRPASCPSGAACVHVAP